MGSLPRFYGDVQAAKYGGIPFHEWEAVPLYLKSQIYASMNAESAAEQEVKQYYAQLQAAESGTGGYEH